FTCGLLVGAGDVYCWGINDFGQLGDGTVGSRVEPGPVSLPTT
ncbi:MAG: RCC1 domain-containing protein, partial [Gemmatimonadota bacterium]|nr:RCC1 domain-containing protein [Gemmatimonadota bacterium]